MFADHPKCRERRLKVSRDPVLRRLRLLAMQSDAGSHRACARLLQSRFVATAGNVMCKGMNSPISCVHILGNEGDANARQWVHAKASEDLDMSMAAPKQDEIL